MADFNIPTDKEIARKAHELIVRDLSLYDSIPALAEKLGTNPQKLKKIFHRYYHTTVFQFSRKQRIEKAKQLLAETNYTLQTIAEQVGYSEGNNFQVAFKTVEGCTPGEWRRNQTQ